MTHTIAQPVGALQHKLGGNTLGDLQATLKLSYLWSGPTDQSYANISLVATPGIVRLHLL